MNRHLDITGASIIAAAQAASPASTTVYLPSGEQVEVAGSYQYAALRTTVTPRKRRRSTIVSKRSNSQTALRQHIARELSKGGGLGLSIEWVIVDIATSRIIERY